jgi:hypothetical protein
MFTSPKAIGLGIVLVGVITAAVIVAIHPNHSPKASSISVNLPVAIPAVTVHTADWYVAHPATLKADDARCGSDAASIPQAACQNAATADQRLLAAQLGQASVINSSTGKASTPSGP